MVSKLMTAIHLTGHGGLDKLVVRTDVEVPQLQAGQVLVRVTAAGMNNTDINTRTGWYNQSVTSGTTNEGGKNGFDISEEGMGDWEGGLTFPRIQGADAVGVIAAVGEGVDPGRIGERVVCDPYIRDPQDEEGLDTAGFLGSEYNGAFAQYAAVPAGNAVAVPHNLPVSDAALATLPCSGGTAMNMLLLAGAKAGDVALVTGASGGVGTFLVQILKAFGATVIAIAGRDKMAAVSELRADHVLERGQDDLVAQVLKLTNGQRLDLVADVVAGGAFPAYLKLLRRGGRYVTAGAIAGPLVTLDLRTLYLKNLSLFGSTVYRRDTFPHLVRLVVDGKVNPFASKTWPLTEIHAAQTEFFEKKHVGSLVLLP
ncbi:zinc-binding dehydrogenase [Pararhizobium sp. YC-54]|uniref:zinc-binding dehydrogenase n=1 Tax=Pararhizobium sp. YC-54 TaxID=2986920 RepID=UPI0021F74B12|nr:zinc-binding dehydrogenase [Pararhizobium sp. YC-54]MCW0001742.1 zinc-binding dehydrogenase [Pararhizobium sp. YC-54]